MFTDNNISMLQPAVPKPSPESSLMQLARTGAISANSQMSREQFHRFMVEHSELKIERDKNGTIIIHPLMTIKSTYNEDEAYFALRSWAKQNKFGLPLGPSAAFDLPDGSTHKADGSWISKTRLKNFSPEDFDSFSKVAPDFVIETRSKTDSLSKLKKKMAEVWMANGVRLAWLIDPKSQKAWVYRAGKPSEEIPNFDAMLSGEEVLPGFEFDLKELK